MERRIVLGVAGMPGAGKGTVKEISLKMGCLCVVMGNEIREETNRRNLEATPENMGRVMLKLREEEGGAVVANRCIPKIERVKERVVIVDGVRNLDEVEEFKKRFPNFSIIAIHSSQQTRFKRLYKRGRSDDAKKWEDFIERDQRELSVGLGDVIATADRMVINEGDKVQLKRQLRKALEAEIAKWMKSR